MDPSRSDRDKMRKMQRTTQSSSSQPYHIPPELIIEILSRLPAKSIARFRSVSKLWSSITTDSDFINSFQTHSSALEPHVLLILRKRDNVFVFPTPLHQNNTDDPYHPVEVGRRSGFVDYQDSVKGYICIEKYSHLVIWNPSMKRYLYLHVPHGTYIRGFLGYDPIHAEYKALCILTDSKIGIRTLVGTQKSWRIVSEGFPKHTPNGACGRCINGVIYYEAYVLQEHVIVSFDVRFEKFSFIKYPSRKQGILCVSYEGRLALVSVEPGADELWILEDAENHKWICKHFPSPPPPPYEKWRLKGVTDAGEFIYIQTEKSLHGSFSVMYFNPKKNTTREVKFGVIGCDDISRLDEVGPFDPSHYVSVIPRGCSFVHSDESSGWR